MVQGLPARKGPSRTVTPGLSGCRAQTRVGGPFPGVLAQDAMTNYHRLDGLNQQSFLIDPEAGKSEIKV